MKKKEVNVNCGKYLHCTLRLGTSFIDRDITIFIQAQQHVVRVTNLHNNKSKNLYVVPILMVSAHKNIMLFSL